MKRMILIAVALTLAGCAGRRERGPTQLIYGAESDGRHQVRPRLGVKTPISRSTDIRAIWRPQFPVYGPNEPHNSSRAPSRELGGFLIEATTDIGR